MHKLREFSGCDFVKFRPFFDVFSRISPLGNTPKMTIRKSGPASEFLENFIEKRRSFFEKNAVFGKAGRPYQKKGEKICCKFLHFWKIRGFFQILNFWSSHITGRFWKIHEKFQFVIFYEKIVKGRKRRNPLFQKTRFFCRKCFLRFFTLEGLCQNEKIRSKNALSAI